MSGNILACTGMQSLVSLACGSVRTFEHPLLKFILGLHQSVRTATSIHLVKNPMMAHLSISIIALHVLLILRAAESQGCSGSSPCPFEANLNAKSPATTFTRGRLDSRIKPVPCASNLKCKKNELLDCETVGLIDSNIGFIPVISTLDAGGVLALFSSSVVPVSTRFLFLDNDQPNLGALFRPTQSFIGTPDNEPFLISLVRAHITNVLNSIFGSYTDSFSQILAPKVRPPAQLEPPPYVFAFDFTLYNRPAFDKVPLRTMLYRRGTFKDGSCELENTFRPIPEEWITEVDSDAFLDVLGRVVIAIPIDIPITRLRVTLDTDEECVGVVFASTTPCCTLNDAKFKDPGCNRRND